MHIFQYHAKIQSAQKFSSPLAQKKDGGAMENKVNFMTVSEWLELFAYILGTIGSVYILTIAYTAAYMPAELAALFLIGTLSCLTIRHFHRTDYSRLYRKDWLVTDIKCGKRKLMGVQIHFKKLSWRWIQKFNHLNEKIDHLMDELDITISEIENETDPVKKDHLITSHDCDVYTLRKYERKLRKMA